MVFDSAGIGLVRLSNSIDINEFCCATKVGSLPLQNFLKHHAHDNQKRKLSITWILVQESEPSTPLGYISLACASIDVEDLNAGDKKGCPKYDRFPALLIVNLPLMTGIMGRDLVLNSWIMSMLLPSKYQKIPGADTLSLNPNPPLPGSTKKSVTLSEFGNLKMEISSFIRM